jgi:hypothetical protein
MCFSLLNMTLWQYDMALWFVRFALLESIEELFAHSTPYVNGK